MTGITLAILVFIFVVLPLGTLTAIAFWPVRPQTSARENMAFWDAADGDYSFDYEKDTNLQGGAVVARQAHNLKVSGSIPDPATNFDPRPAPRDEDAVTAEVSPAGRSASCKGCQASEIESGETAGETAASEADEKHGESIGGNCPVGNSPSVAALTPTAESCKSIGEMKDGTASDNLDVQGVMVIASAGKVRRLVAKPRGGQTERVASTPSGPFRSQSLLP